MTSWASWSAEGRGRKMVTRSGRKIAGCGERPDGPDIVDASFAIWPDAPRVRRSATAGWFARPVFLSPRRWDLACVSARGRSSFDEHRRLAAGRRDYGEGDDAWLKTHRTDFRRMTWICVRG